MVGSLISSSFVAIRVLRMILKSFNSLNISLLLFWLRLGCAVLVNRLFLLVILTLILLSSPPWPREFQMTNGLIWSVLLRSVAEFLLRLLVNSNMTKMGGSRRDFLLKCPIALAAASACCVLPDRWFAPHFGGVQT